MDVALPDTVICNDSNANPFTHPSVSGFPMRRSTIIAKCLVNSNMHTRLEDAESHVNQVFEKCFPGQDFLAWNLNVDDHAAENVIQTVGKAISISVDLLILDLWDEMTDPVKEAHRRRLW
jgi:hypothetical protein